MAEQTHIIAKASEFIKELFTMNLPGHLLYHTYDHTRSVAETASKIGKGMKLGEEGIEVVTLAGWFHDTGYTELYKGHEEVSIRIAKDFLHIENYPEDKIELIAGCIRATKIPQQPKNLLEEIVADADLAGLGRKSFFEQSSLLHREWEEEFDKEYTEEEWTQQNIELLSGHKYFTRFAEGSYSERQKQNLLILHENFRKIHSLIEKDQPATHKQLFSENTFANGNLHETGTQILFKMVSNTLMMENLSADHKALIMIFANAIMIITGLVGLVTELQDRIADFRIITPISVLLIFSALTIIFSVSALRQRSGTDNEKKRKKMSSLFGIFYAMSYDDFDRRMKEIGNNNDLLFYGAMSREYFEQRIMVSKKYRYLQYGYMIFMYGFCLTVLTFFFAFFN